MRELADTISTGCVWGAGAYLLGSSSPMGWAVTMGISSGLVVFATRVDGIAKDRFVMSLWYFLGSVFVANRIAGAIGYPLQLGRTFWKISSVLAVLSLLVPESARQAPAPQASV